MTRALCYGYLMGPSKKESQMKSLTLALLASALFLAPAAHAVPNGNANGYWTHGPGSRPGPADTSPPSTPEPTAALVFGVGLAAVWIAARRSR